MPQHDDAPRDLLFGLLALQNGLVSRDQLVAAFALWTASGGRPMADVLTDQEALSSSHRTLVEALVEAHLKLHGGDPEKSLAALDLNRSTRESLVAAGGTQVEASIALVGSGSGSDGDVEYTNSYAVGTATSDGQRFRVLRPHAQGGLGAVFVALDGELNREVALKQILDHHADDPVSRQRFLVEAEITGGLEHPGIVPVYGLGTYGDGRPYYAMRFIRGDSLREAVEHFHADASLRADPGRRSLELRKLLRRFLDVCNAVEYAHSRGVLHRDIKPGNVIVGKHGETLVVDWGLAKPLGHAEPSAGEGERTLMPSSASGNAETLPGSALGTPAYMSPEQAAGDLDRLGRRSDVYSLGATLYCLLTGKPPFKGEVFEVLRKVQKGAFPPPRQLDPSIDPALEAVCLKAMETRPDDRYASCRALADDLERWAADEPVSAFPEGLRLRLARWSRRNRAWVRAAQAALLVLLVMTGALAVQQSLSAERERQAFLREQDANKLAQTRLAQVEKANDLLVAIFEDIDPRSTEQKGRTLLEILGGRLEQAAEQVDGAQIADTMTVAKLQIGLGKALLNLGHHAKALELFERSRLTRTAERGREDEGALDANSHLAHAYYAVGRFTEAAALAEETLELQSARLGPMHPDTIQTRELLSVIYERLGRLAEAIPMQEESLRRQTSLHGPDHSYVLNSRNNLAHLYAEAGRLAEAIAMQEETLKRQTTTLGPDHPSTLNSRSNLAKWYARAGRLAAAIAMDEETLRLRASTLGIDHPDTLVSRNNLAFAYAIAGRWAEAATLYEDNLRRYELTLSPDHPGTLNARNNLVNAYEALGRWAAAEPLRRDNLARRRKSEKPDSLAIAGELALLGMNLGKQSKWTEAETTLRESLAIREQAIPDQWPRFNTMSQLGGALLGQRRFAEAEPLIVQGYEGLKSRERVIPRSGRARLPEAADRVIRLYETWNKPEKASEWKTRLGLADLPDDVFARP